VRYDKQAKTNSICTFTELIGIKEMEANKWDFFFLKRLWTDSLVFAFAHVSKGWFPE
jgi:hypothetical protein